MRRRGIGVGAASLAAACALVAAGCGGSDGGPVTLNLLGPLDPGGTNTKAAKECSDAIRRQVRDQAVAGGQQRRRVARARRPPARGRRQEHRHHQHGHDLDSGVRGGRLAAGAQGLPRRTDALDDVLDGPKASVQWKDKTYAIPLNTNVQLLWYRKDLVPKPPETWDEMIAMAKKLPAGEGNILEQGQKYEGYVVWFNNLVASAGGTIVDAEGRPDARRRGRQGRADHQGRRDLRPRRPVAVDRAGGPGPARLRGRQGRLPAQLAVRLRRRARGRRDQRRSRRRSSRTWATPAGPASTRASRARSRSAAPTSASRRRARTPSWRPRPRCA